MQRHGQECTPWPGAQVIGGFQQAYIELDQSSVQGKNEERQVGVNQAYVYRQIGAIDFQRLGNQAQPLQQRSEEHTSELQSLMRISYAVFCLKKKKKTPNSESITKKTT